MDLREIRSKGGEKMVKNGEKTLAKSFGILEAAAASPGGLEAREIAERTGIPLSTAFRMMKFLAGAGYLCAREGRYTLGYGLLRLGAAASRQNPLARAGHRFLEELAARTRETVHLAELQDGRVVYVDKVEGVRSVRMGSLIGHSGPVYCTGVGKAMLAFLPEEERERIIAGLELERFTPSTVTDPAQLRRCLEVVRRRRYAVDDCEHENGVFCIASCVLDRRGRAVAAVSVSGAELYLRGQVTAIAPLVRDCASKIASALGL